MWGLCIAGAVFLEPRGQPAVVAAAGLPAATGSGWRDSCHTQRGKADKGRCFARKRLLCHPCWFLMTAVESWLVCMCASCSRLL
jgi:hypothetical protein